MGGLPRSWDPYMNKFTRVWNRAAAVGLLCYSAYEGVQHLRQERFLKELQKTRSGLELALEHDTAFVLNDAPVRQYELSDSVQSYSGGLQQKALSTGMQDTTPYNADSLFIRYRSGADSLLQDKFDDMMGQQATGEIGNNAVVIEP